MGTTVLDRQNNGSEKERFDLVVDGGIVKKQRKKNTIRKAGAGLSTWYFIGLVSQLGFSIALPIAGGALLGQFLDAKWHTYPRTTLSLLLLGIVISLVYLIRTIQEVIHTGRRQN